MIQEVEKKEMSETKSSRWLGYVVGVLVIKNIIRQHDFINLSKFRNKTENDTIISHISVAEHYLKNDNIRKMIYLNFENEYRFNDFLKKLLLDKWNSVDSNYLLGFLQGILCIQGLINVEEERERTRNIFSGE